MRKKLWINLALLLVIPGLLFTVSCAKKTVKSEAVVEKQAEEEAVMKAREAEQARQQEMTRQRAIEEERLREEARLKEMQMAAQNRFVNEDIHFEFDSSVLLPDAQETLGRKAEWMRNNPYVNAIVEGHCDERGTNEYNLALGERRAVSAKNYLMDLGIAASRLTTISYGEERPMDLGHNEEVWAKNRRAHFVIE